jgi:TrmH family RNA methyltransferase
VDDRADRDKGVITSPRNAQIKALRGLYARQGRRRASAAPLEGAHLVEEALAAGVPLLAAYLGPAFLARDDGARLAAALESAGVPLTLVADEVLRRVADAEAPQGVVAVAAIRRGGDPAEAAQAIGERARRSAAGGPGVPVAVLAERVQDPGNLGTIVRAVDAAGGAGVVVTAGTVDPYSPKVLRASAGSLFHVPLLEVEDVAEALALLRPEGLAAAATLPVGGELPWRLDLRRPTLLLVGNEGSGLSPAAVTAARACVTVPMPGRAESLNVGVTAAVLLYEALRQAAAPDGGR